MKKEICFCTARTKTKKIMTHPILQTEDFGVPMNKLKICTPKTNQKSWFSIFETIASEHDQSKTKK
jgi:hypothetical protein